jgi:hypothetical protein
MGLVACSIAFPGNPRSRPSAKSRDSSSYLAGSSKAFTRSYNPLSARIADMLYFFIAVNETDNAALRYGTLHMKDFFREFARINITGK